jgi:hypothetical protein
MRPVFDQEKFDTLILYVASQCPDPTRLGAVRLRKILYFADVLHYAKTGHPLTGATYIKWEYGPVPRELVDAERRLETRRALVIRRSAHPLGHPMTHYYVLSDPDLSRFAPEEISLVDELIRAICDDHTAASISAASHHHAWQVAEIGEELPYETIFVSRFAEITPEAVEWAKSEIERYERQPA